MHLIVLLLSLLFVPKLLDADVARSQEVLGYWFGSLDEYDSCPKDRSPLWFMKSEKTDREIMSRFLKDLNQAAVGAYDSWKESPRGRLALIILMDQMSRNIYRGTPRAFATDPQALQLSLEAIESGEDQQLFLIERAFLYMPLEHSEDSKVQKLSVQKFSELVKSAPEHVKPVYESFLDYAKQHRRIIDRFGRYPHRNEILGRKSTSEEVEFLKRPGSSF